MIIQIRIQFLKDLINEINYDKIYIYTNGTYGHGEEVVNNLYLNVDGIFARDNIPYMAIIHHLIM